MILRAVREGKRLYAAKSVNGATLENKNPTAFGAGMGYRVY